MKQFWNGDFEIFGLVKNGKSLDFLVPNLGAKIWTINLANMFGPMLRDEMRLELKAPAIWFALMLSYILDFLCWTFQINRVVFFNHQGFSTNLHNHRQIADFQLSLPEIGNEFKNAAIIIRSVCENEINKYPIPDFRIPTRLVFIHNTPHIDLKNRSNCKKDERLLKRYGLKIVKYNAPFSGETINTALNQYRQLYLEKYSKNSPDFTDEYFQKLLESRDLEFFGIENKDGALLAFFALYINENQATPALIGYDKNSDLPLYRALMLEALKEAASRGLILNNSAGAPIFKARRGGKAQIEFMLVYCEHLDPWRKFGYFVIERISHLLLPIFRKIAQKI